MIKVTKAIIEECAHNLMFELSEDQADLILEDFSTVMAQIDFLKNIEGVDQADEMTFPYKEHQKLLRDDKPTKPLKAQDAVKNSGTKLGNQIKLPKVVGNKHDQVDE